MLYNGYIICVQYERSSFFMAFISVNSIKQIEKEHNHIHQPVDTTYSTFIIDGKKFFQIDTYGSVDRKYPEKISQSIQFDADTAKKLVEIVQKEFNIHN